ncbi:MAG: tripartite tricarboxylate transporter substrate binding protein [Burkholderiales bacterium]|nr:tripartite tricarboxylate transporter substrate binding protein [Burkholderiales bacterium]MDE2398176.1 tripartite tricarboxylate transporter substrate binding protein [Burkholderiales bacterium]MDE2457438.1 tripartite tricarboxylate transporter substrate binding protein [Burkholderiales bacterium]
MKTPTSTRRTLLRLTGLALALAAGTALADSEPFPNRSITIIVPYSAGTGSDSLARAIGQAVAEKSHQSVVVENHDGGGSLVGTLAAARARPDGYTILIVANPFVIGPTQRNPPPYDPIKDFQPIAKVAIIPLVLASTVSLPVKNIGELVAYARANPGKLSYASSGPGTISQQEMEVFKDAAGLDIVEVGYKSTAQALTDVIGGHVPLFPVVVSSVLPHLKAGRIHVLGVFDVRRSPLIPDIPSMSEALGLPGYTPTPVWYGFVAPAGTPREAMQALSALFQGAMQTQAVKDRLSELGAQPISPSNEQFVADMKAETAKAAELFKRSSASAGAVEGKARP